MRKTDVPNALTAAIWALLLVNGVQGIIAVQEQNVPGYPARGQFILYIAIPTIFLILSVSAALMSRRLPWFYNLYPVTVLLIACAMLPVLMLWTGGV